MMRKKIYFIGMIMTMVLIFCFSCQSGEESQQTSGMVQQMVSAIASMLGFNQSYVFTDTAAFIIRKMAHMTEYAVLSVFSYLFLKEQRREQRKEPSFRKSAAGALLICFLYACTDEFHQLFVPDRAGQMRDVFIDTSGACIALIVLAISSRRNRKKSQEKQVRE